MKHIKRINKILQIVQIGLSIILAVMMLKGIKMFFIMLKGG